MPIRISLNIVLTFCLLLLPFSITICAQSPSRTQSSETRGIEVSFLDAQVKTALRTFAYAVGLNIVFDDSVSDYQSITIKLNHVTTMESVLEIALLQQGLAARLIEDKTIIVFPDNLSNQQWFAEYNRWPENRDIALQPRTSRPEDLAEEKQDFAFNDEDLGSVMRTLGDRLKLNIVLHSGVRTYDKVTIDLRSVTTEQAIKEVLTQKKYTGRIVGENTIMIFRGDLSRRGKDADYKPWPTNIDAQR